jgi:pimeloyl-ACP methyl ester carboxylesterase
MAQATPQARPVRRLPHLSPAKLARLRRMFAILGAISPTLAARVLIDRFQRPGRRRQLDAVDEAMLLRARHERLRVGDDDLQVYLWGRDDAPTVVLLHGWGSHAPRWSGFVEQIVAQGWRAIAFDAPAHGRSSGVRSSLPRFHAALDAVAVRYGPAHAFIAHSFGALTVATRLADADAPLRAAAAVLISLPRDAGYLLDLYLDMIEASARVRDAVHRLFVARFGVPPSTFSALTGASRVETPVLVVHDREDEAVPHDHSLEISALLPNGTLHLTQGLGHNRLLRDPTLIGTVMDFVRSAPARA